MSNEIGEKFLPIGTVVLLKNGTKRIMINGFCALSEDDKNNIYDYSGVLFPEGVLKHDQTLLFNHEQIEKIYSVGYQDEEQFAFKVKADKALADIRDKESSAEE